MQAEQAERDKEAEERRRVKAEERRQEREHRRQKGEEEKAKEVEEAKRKEAQREATLDEIADDLDQARKIRSSAMRQVRHVLEALAGANALERKAREMLQSLRPQAKKMPRRR